MVVSTLTWALFGLVSETYGLCEVLLKPFAGARTWVRCLGRECEENGLLEADLSA